MFINYRMHGYEDREDKGGGDMNDINFIDPKNYLGFHSFMESNKFKDYFQEIIDKECYSSQIMLTSHNFVLKNKFLNEKDVKNSQLLQKTYNLKLFSHTCLMHNLTGHKKDKDTESYVNAHSFRILMALKNVAQELDIMSLFNGACVIHVGRTDRKDEGILNISKHINKILRMEKMKECTKFECGERMLLLENSAGERNTLGNKLKELKIIYDNVEKRFQKNIGFCIDTCHIFASGEYNLSIESEIDRLFIDLNRVLGIENIKLIHLNDSKCEFDSRKDRHENLCEGYIFNRTTLRHLIEKCVKYEIPYVLETPMNNREQDINILKNLFD
jgi:apurinic endonuclease APN1